MTEQSLQARELKTLASFTPADTRSNRSPECRDNVLPNCTPKSEQDDHVRVDWTAICLMLGSGILTVLWHVFSRS